MLWGVRIGVVCSMLLLLPALALGQVDICVDWENPPLMCSRDGEGVGFYCDVVREAFARIGESVHIRPVPWKRVMDGVRQGECGAAGLIKTEERAKVLDFTIPIHQERIMVFVRGRNVQALCGPMRRLHGKTVGAIIGWSYGAAFDDAVSEGRILVLCSRSDETNLKLLLIDRVDAFVAPCDSAGAVIAATPAAHEVVACPEPVSVNDTYIAFAKSFARQDLIPRLDEAIGAMHQDGTMARLRHQYGIAD